MARIPERRFLVQDIISNESKGVGTRREERIERNSETDDEDATKIDPVHLRPVGIRPDQAQISPPTLPRTDLRGREDKYLTEPPTPTTALTCKNVTVHRLSPFAIHCSSQCGVPNAHDQVHICCPPETIRENTASIRRSHTSQLV